MSAERSTPIALEEERPDNQIVKDYKNKIDEELKIVN